MRKRWLTLVAALGIATLIVGLATATASRRGHSPTAVAAPAVAKELGLAFGTGFRAKMTGTVEVPQGDPNATGTALIRLNAAEGLVCFKLVVTGANAPIIASHIHRGATGVAGPVVVGFIPLTTSATDSNVQQSKGCVSADPALIREIAGNPSGFYVNVHNKNFPAGVVRGQLVKLKEAAPKKKTGPKPKKKHG
jgi:hypothetical protein